MNPHQIVEAVLFASDAPLTADELARADESLDEDQVEEALRQLRAEYADGQRSFDIVEVAEGYQILTRPEFAPYLERFDNVPRPARLSGPALETLGIIAYRQPIGRLEIEYIRGVGSSGVIHTLQDRQLVDVVGRAEGLGRPLLYGTTRFFLEHFGFRSLEDLPRPEDLPVVLRERIPLGPESDEEEREGEEPTLFEAVDGAADGGADGAPTHGGNTLDAAGESGAVDVEPTHDGVGSDEAAAREAPSRPEDDGTSESAAEPGALDPSDPESGREARD